MKRLRALDLYSGVGGWSLGLGMAGIDVVASYELSPPANRTNRLNNRHRTHLGDIRDLNFDNLPKQIDIIVGSPPCTEFSFSNRGGNGDIDDGLEDIIQFLEVVDHIQPRFWVVENVPRVSHIIERELIRGGKLYKFRKLNIAHQILNMADFGVPQRRRRCIAGNFDFDLLKSYCNRIRTPTLGDVVCALQKRIVVDPLYAFQIPKAELTDHHPEDFLSEEEARINRAAKLFHPVYNGMWFPDRLDKPVRTITATCTRVSRESIVILEPGTERRYRRLTLRERACLQSFPLTFQFYGHSNGQKLSMIGNAVPPLFAYYVGKACKGVLAGELPTVPEFDNFRGPVRPVPITKPESVGRRFPASRRFRFAVPSLRLKSGVRFELTNQSRSRKPHWSITFTFGTSKSIHKLRMDQNALPFLLERLSGTNLQRVRRHLKRLRAYLQNPAISHLQNVWSRRGAGKLHPFDVLDRLDEAARKLIPIVQSSPMSASQIVNAGLVHTYGIKPRKLLGVPKLLRHAPLIASGLLIGSITNVMLDQSREAGGVGAIQAKRREAGHRAGNGSLNAKRAQRSNGAYSPIRHKAGKGSSHPSP